MLSKKEFYNKGYDKLDLKEISKLIRKELKKEFKQDIKFNVRIKRYPNEINVNIKEINKKCLCNLNELKDKEFNKTNNEIKEIYDICFKENDFKRLLKKDIYIKIWNIIDKYNYNDSDIYSDYFSYNYYSFLYSNNTILKE